MDFERLSEYLERDRRDIEELTRDIKGDLEKDEKYFSGYWTGQIVLLQALGEGFNRNIEDPNIPEDMKKAFSWSRNKFLQQAFNYEQALKKAIFDLTGKEAVIR